jgi:hypothetical protein
MEQPKTIPEQQLGHDYQERQRALLEGLPHLLQDVEQEKKYILQERTRLLEAFEGIKGKPGTDVHELTRELVFFVQWVDKTLQDLVKEEQALNHMMTLLASPGDNKHGINVHTAEQLTDLEGYAEQITTFLQREDEKSLRLKALEQRERQIMQGMQKPHQEH